MNKKEKIITLVALVTFICIVAGLQFAAAQALAPSAVLPPRARSARTACYANAISYIAVDERPEAFGKKNRNYADSTEQLFKTGRLRGCDPLSRQTSTAIQNVLSLSKLTE